jgi:hypothetical protein
MKVTINGYTIEIFAGAKVGDAVQAWAVENEEQLNAHRYTITDADGLEVSPDGPAMEGMELTITKEMGK